MIRRYVVVLFSIISIALFLGCASTQQYLPSIVDEDVSSSVTVHLKRTFSMGGAHLVYVLESDVEESYNCILGIQNPRPHRYGFKIWSPSLSGSPGRFTKNYHLRSDDDTVERSLDNLYRMETIETEKGEKILKTTVLPAYFNYLNRLFKKDKNFTKIDIENSNDYITFQKMNLIGGVGYTGVLVWKRPPGKINLSLAFIDLYYEGEFGEAEPGDNIYIDVDNTIFPNGFKFEIKTERGRP